MIKEIAIDIIKRAIGFILDIVFKRKVNINMKTYMEKQSYNYRVGYKFAKWKNAVVLASRTFILNIISILIIRELYGRISEVIQDKNQTAYGLLISLLVILIFSLWCKFTWHITSIESGEDTKVEYKNKNILSCYTPVLISNIIYLISLEGYLIFKSIIKLDGNVINKSILVIAAIYTALLICYIVKYEYVKKHSYKIIVNESIDKTQIKFINNKYDEIDSLFFDMVIRIRKDDSIYTSIAYDLDDKAVLRFTNCKFSKEVYKPEEIEYIQIGDKRLEYVGNKWIVNNNI